MATNENLINEYITLKYAKKKRDRLLDVQELLIELNLPADNEIDFEIHYYNNIINEIRKYICHVSIHNRTEIFEPDSIYCVF
tara:strand:+ start:140 stop:385 length:246 start_codon:yes stop_codon:yes gene_type:complete